MDWVQLIGELRARGYTQQELADLCGCGQSTINDLAVGRTKDPRHSIGSVLRQLHEQKEKA
jgi:transcriptional regulator with XRE-family HTH domain